MKNLKELNKVVNNLGSWKLEVVSILKDIITELGKVKTEIKKLKIELDSFEKLVQSRTSKEYVSKKDFGKKG